MHFTIDQNFLEQTLSDLVQINSVNPDLHPSGPGEAKIAAYLARSLADLGLSVTPHEPEAGRVSVVARLAGQGGGKSLMLNGHIDTVDVEGMPEAFSGAIREGKLYGRGSYDMKASVAAAMAAAKALSEAGIKLQGDLLIAGVADEEYASLGTQDLIKHYQVDGAIVTEPTHLDICLAHKGFVWLEVETLGRAAHGSRFELGIDANMHMGRFLAKLAQLEQDLRQRDPHPLVGPPSLHAATLSGGTALSVYAAQCTLGIERRTIPGESEAQVRAEIQNLLDELTSADSQFQARLKAILVRPPFEVAQSAKIVQSVAQAFVDTQGKDPVYRGDTPWMDSAFLAEAGVETVVIGPSGGGAHAKEEWVDLESVHQLSRILAQTAINYCGLAG